MNINTSLPVNQPMKYQEDPRIAGLRAAMGIELVEDTRFVDATGTVRGYTRVQSKDKEGFFDQSRKMMEKLQEEEAQRRQERAENSRENDSILLSMISKNAVVPAKGNDGNCTEVAHAIDIKV